MRMARPGRDSSVAEQRIGLDGTSITPRRRRPASTQRFPQPYTTYGIGLPQGVLDTRFPTDLPNGPYQISKYVPYAAYTGDPVHRFFQMWQDYDGGKTR